MRLSISNIAWQMEDDQEVYELMKKYGYSGLEIAPTRIFPEQPYEKTDEAKKWADELRREHGFIISSMQSVWFGRQEKLFGTDEDRRILLDYTKEAIDFAEAVGCKNFVFGCPRNRNLPEGADASAAVPFFKSLGEYALAHHTVIGMEANPPIYHTNYINDTPSAFELVEKVDSNGFKLNLDMGTVIQNKEDITEIAGKVKHISHVHISEPGLKPIKKNDLHRKLREILEKEKYQGMISIEMGRVDNLADLEVAMKYVKKIFG